MQGESGVRCSTPLEQALIGANLRTEMSLLPGLEEKLYISVQGICTASKQSGGSRQHGCVYIVSASVHSAGVLRRELKTRVLGHGQGVHVGPEKNTSSGRPAFQGRDEACRTLAFLDLKPKVRQRLEHQGPGLGQVVSELGFSVERSTQIDHRWQNRLGLALEFIKPHRSHLPDWRAKVPDFLPVLDSPPNLPASGFRAASAVSIPPAQRRLPFVSTIVLWTDEMVAFIPLSTEKSEEPLAMRVQLALNVRDLDEAVDFYSKLFNTDVNKRKPGYANFSIAEPPLKLVLFEDPDAEERLNHLGVEVFSDEEVHSATDRLKVAGMADRVEDEETCCYAEQNKVWSVDPQGMRWEWYRVVRDSEEFGSQAAPEASGSDCCG
jgi:catechol 2,3-dioxygenase-like lactoylglutathione lyase family enzyme